MVVNESAHQVLDTGIVFMLHIHFIVQIILTGLTSALGIVANIINIIIFTRQMKSENTGASLRGLAITDLLTTIASLWQCINWGITLVDPPNLPWIASDITQLIASGPYMTFSQMTKMETAYLAFERCVCVVFPFKVKTMFTPKRTNIVTVVIIITCIVGNSPYFIVQWPAFVTDPVSNKTRLGVKRLENWFVILNLAFSFNFNLFHIGSVVIVTFSTIITVIFVNLSKAWRESMMSSKQSSVSNKFQKEASTTSGSPPGIESRSSGGHKVKEKSKSNSKKITKEKKLVMMITTISAMFFVSFTPNIVYLVAKVFGLDLSTGGANHHLGVLVYSISFYLETLNSSLNILVYYYMSAKFKHELRRILNNLPEEKSVQVSQSS